METRMKKAALAALAAAATLGFAPMSAQAQYSATLTTSCYNGNGTVGLALDNVQAAILAGSFTNQRDQTNMLGKVSNAASKASLRKWGDANDKLSDISDQAVALAGAAKPKLAGADAIVNAAYGAQMCMNGL